jgi:hypothetical protein
MSEQFKVRAFGNDCLGNITGYIVERYRWVPRPWSARSDGLVLERETGGQFVGNLYRPGSFEQARQLADLCATALNAGTVPA